MISQRFLSNSYSTIVTKRHYTVYNSAITVKKTTTFLFLLLLLRAQYLQIWILQIWRKIRSIYIRIFKKKKDRELTLGFVLLLWKEKKNKTNIIDFYFILLIPLLLILSSHSYIMCAVYIYTRSRRRKKATTLNYIYYIDINKLPHRR
jgi:hypothetical protein